MLLLSGLFFNGRNYLSNYLSHLSDSLDGLAIIRLGLNLCRNLLEGLLNEGVQVLAVVVGLDCELADILGKAGSLRFPFLLAEAGAGCIMERVHLVYHCDEGGSLLLGELAVLLRSDYETHLGHHVEGVFNLGLDVHLGCLFDLFGLGGIHTRVAGVR